jgi:hypothetical protein
MSGTAQRGDAETCGEMLATDTGETPAESQGGFEHRIGKKQGDTPGLRHTY